MAGLARESILASRNELIKTVDGRDTSYEFSVNDFKQVQRMIYQLAGIRLADTKQDMVYSRIIRRLRATGVKTFRDYLALVESSPEEMEGFINSLTTNLTSFFREDYHFPILEKMMQAHKGRARPFRIWCSAASTGEEPYSLAMTAAKVFGANPPVEIIATDIDTNVLAKADRAVYRAEHMDRIDEVYHQYFLRGKGKNEGLVRIKPGVRKLVKFLPLNLLDNQWPLTGTFDALFCRNVLIYFDKDTQRRVLMHFVPFMTPQSQLFVGHSESLLHMADSFKLLGKTVYQLRAADKA